MAKIDLKPLSLSELKSLRTRVDKAIVRHDKAKKTKALAAVKAKAKEMGFSLSELTTAVAGTATKAKSPVKPKSKPAYRDPKNKSNTWTGRGPRPKWMKEALENGASMDDLKI